MSADLKAVDALVQAIEAKQRASIYLFFGDEALTEQAARRVAEALIPEGSRDFNLEQVDGSNTNAGEFLRLVNTYGFFPGDKAVVVQNTGLFLSNKNAGDLQRRSAEAWGKGQKARAGRLFLQLLALGGVSVEQLRGGHPAALKAKPFKELFGVALDDTSKGWAQELTAYCNDGELSPAGMGDDASQLADALEKGLGDRSVLVLTAPAVDKRRRIFKLVQKHGQVVDLSIDYGWRDNELPADLLRQVVHDRVQKAGKRISSRAVEAIGARSGAGVRGLHSELDKLLAYVGNRNQVDVEDVEACLVQAKEAHRFDITDALSERDLARLVKAIRGNVGAGSPTGAALQIIGGVAGGLRNLVGAREYIDLALGGRFDPRQRYDSVKSQMIDAGKALGNMNPFRAWLLCKAACRYRMDELLDGVIAVQETDVALKSSSVHKSPIVQLEAMAVRICGVPKARNPRADQSRRRY